MAEAERGCWDWLSTLIGASGMEEEWRRKQPPAWSTQSLSLPGRVEPDAHRRAELCKWCAALSGLVKGKGKALPVGCSGVVIMHASLTHTLLEMLGEWMEDQPAALLAEY